VSGHWVAPMEVSAHMKAAVYSKAEAGKVLEIRDLDQPLPRSCGLLSYKARLLGPCCRTADSVGRLALAVEGRSHGGRNHERSPTIWACTTMLACSHGDSSAISAARLFFSIASSIAIRWFPEAIKEYQRCPE
jgi:hypothetical protein